MAIISKAEVMSGFDLKPVSFLRCMGVGHEFRTSRAKPGYVTCVRCKYRQKA